MSIDEALARHGFSAEGLLKLSRKAAEDALKRQPAVVAELKGKALEQR